VAAQVVASRAVLGSTELVSYKEELPDQWKEYITVPIYKRSNKTGYSYYEISLLSTLIVSSILLSRLSTHTVGIIGDHQ
jgi:hypothetical protein